MHARSNTGYYCFGGVPRGYVYGKVPGHGNMLVRDEPIASVIAEALNGFASGRFQGQAELKAFLEDQPEFMRRYPSGKVRYEEIKRMLNRALYAGYIDAPSLNRPLFKGHHEPLISLDTYTRIQERLKEGARVPFRKDIDQDFPLRGFVTCAECGNPLTSCWSKSKTGKKHPYYMCFQKGCGSYRKSIRKAEIEGAFGDLIRSATPSAACLTVAEAMFRDIWHARLDQAKDAAQSYAKSIREITAQVDRLLDKLVESDNKRVIAVYEQKISDLETQRLLLEEKAANAGQPQHPFEEVFELAVNFLSSPWKLWESNRLDLQRLVLKLTFSTRIAHARNEGFRTPNLTLAFKALGGPDMQKNKLAGREGLQQSSIIKPVSCKHPRHAP